MVEACSRPGRIAILGTGNIGTDLIYKVARSAELELVAVAGIDPESDGLQRAAARGVATTAAGLNGLRELDVWPEVEIVIDATSAYAHREHAPVLAADGKFAIDLTPAALGQFVVPDISMPDLSDGTVDNVNLVSCGCQATAPFVAALNRAVDGGLPYVEVVTTNSSPSAGPGTRANLDEYVRSTSAALCDLAGAKQAKTIAILNPAVPPITMRNSIYAEMTDASKDRVLAELDATLARVQKYIPGCRMRLEPQFRSHRGVDFCVFTLTVEGAGDYLPTYAGNLDVMTSAAVRVAEAVNAQRRSLRDVEVTRA